MLKLYTYFRSSAAYRVRIALNLKRLGYAAIPTEAPDAGLDKQFSATASRAQIWPEPPLGPLAPETPWNGTSRMIIEVTNSLRANFSFTVFRRRSSGGGMSF